MRGSGCLWTKSKSGSSQMWLQRQARDVFVKERDKQGYVARAAFKLLDMDAKRRFLKPRAAVLDLGAAPGGWTQVALRKGCGPVVSCDLLEHSLPPGDPCLPQLQWIKGDFTSAEVQARMAARLGGQCDVLLCDAAPDYAGQASLDHIRLIALARTAFDLSDTLLKARGGTLVVKVSRGGDEIKLREAMRRKFVSAEFVKPEASRKESTEIYLLAQR